MCSQRHVVYVLKPVQKQEVAGTKLKVKSIDLCVLLRSSAKWKVLYRDSHHNPTHIPTETDEPTKSELVINTYSGDLSKVNKPRKI
jgi:hypothetical protein